MRRGFLFEAPEERVVVERELGGWAAADEV
jgi:hypothetical protein